MRISDWSSDVCSSDLPDIHLRREAQRQAFLPAGDVGAAGAIAQRPEIDAVFVLQDAAQPQRQRHLVFRYADRPAFEILRTGDAPVRPDIERAETKRARYNDRNRDMAHSATHQHTKIDNKPR